MVLRRRSPKRLSGLLGLASSTNNLSEKNARFVRFFEMRNTRNRPIYDLFFATNSDIGHYKMKEAMWRLDAAGDFRFSDGVSYEQATLFGPEPQNDYAPSLWGNFRGQTVYSDEVLQYTRDKTAFLEKHAKGALKLLEADGGFRGRLIDGRFDQARWKVKKEKYLSSRNADNVRRGSELEHVHTLKHRMD